MITTAPGSPGLTMLLAASEAAASSDSPWGQLAQSLTDVTALGIRYVSLLGMLMVSLCILTSLYRILKGPTLTDRILASDALSLFVVALVLLLGEALETAVFYDAALMVAILGFVSTIAMSRFLLASKAPSAPAPAPQDTDSNESSSSPTKEAA